MVQQSTTSDSSASNDIVSALALLEPFRDTSKKFINVEGSVYKITKPLGFNIEAFVESLPTSMRIFNFSFLTSYYGSSPDMIKDVKDIELLRTDPDTRDQNINDAIIKRYLNIRIRSERGFFGLVKGSILPKLLESSYRIKSASVSYSPGGVKYSNIKPKTYVRLTRSDQGTFLDSMMHIKPGNEVMSKPLIIWLASSVSGNLPTN